MFDPTQLDQVNDVVQRLGYSDKRKRNQALRAGMENPGAFQEQNSGIIKEAQQPSDFMGAGRKLAANQNVSTDLSNIFQGNLTKHGNEWYSYGDTDYSTAQIGTKGYQLKDQGLGRYNVLDQGGNNIGTHYGSTVDAINAYARQKFNPQGRINEYQKSDDEWGNNLRTVYGFGGDEWSRPQIYETYNEALEGLMASEGIGNYHGRDDNALSRWEVLGQVLSGDLNKAGYSDSHGRYLPGNNRTEYIKGLNSLYDTNPLIHNGKILGYLGDMGPAQPGTGGYVNPFALSKVDNKGNTRSNYSLFRDVDPEAWKKFATFTGNGENFFVPTEKATEDLPGWAQKDSAQYSHKSSGIGSKIASLIGTGLSIFGGPLAPVGYAINTGVALNNNNPLGALASIFGGAMNLSAADIAGSVGGTYGSDLVGVTAPSNALSQAFGGINPALVSGAIGGITSAAKGQNPILGALGSGLGSVASSGLRSLFDSKAFGDIVGGAANTGIKSLFNQGQAIRGSEYAGRSGGLNAFLNQTPTTGDINQRALSEEEKAEVIADYRRRMIQQAQRGA